MALNVLSLCDGLGGARLALDELNISVKHYHRAEIDKYCNQVFAKNWDSNSYTNYGNVAKLKGSDLPKIDLLVSGFPCQPFSLARTKGKKNFDDPRSQLFYEVLRIFKEVKPKYFLFENVKMKKESQDLISKELGVEPILINSSLVSAQNRKRLYWTNLKFDMPTEQGIVLKDILETNPVFKPVKQTLRNARHFKRVEDKSLCLTATSWKGAGNNGCTLVGHATDINGHDLLKRIYSKNGKSPTLTTCGGGNTEPKVELPEETWRKLTPLECHRLQGVKDGYCSSVSNTQQYKMLGNGFNVQTIKVIFSAFYFQKDFIEVATAKEKDFMKFFFIMEQIKKHEEKKGISYE